MRIIIIATIFIICGCARPGCHHEQAKIISIGMCDSWTNLCAVETTKGFSKDQLPIIGKEIPQEICK